MSGIGSVAIFNNPCVWKCVGATIEYWKLRVCVLQGVGPFQYTPTLPSPSSSFDKSHSTLTLLTTKPPIPTLPHPPTHEPRSPHPNTRRRRVDCCGCEVFLERFSSSPLRPKAAFPYLPHRDVHGIGEGLEETVRALLC